MIKYKYCLKTFMTAVVTIGVGTLLGCFQSSESIPWWLEAFGVFMVTAPFLFMALFGGTFDKLVMWCDRADQAREDERFLNGKK